MGRRQADARPRRAVCARASSGGPSPKEGCAEKLREPAARTSGRRCLAGASTCSSGVEGMRRPRLGIALARRRNSRANPGPRRPFQPHPSGHSQHTTNPGPPHARKTHPPGSTAQPQGPDHKAMVRHLPRPLRQHQQQHHHQRRCGESYQPEEARGSRCTCQLPQPESPRKPAPPPPPAPRAAPAPGCEDTNPPTTPNRHRPHHYPACTCAAGHTSAPRSRGTAANRKQSASEKEANPCQRL